ncbi:MAG: hypothetical protein ACRD5H_04365 [Nitrososphaerales archaeon]
MPKFKVLLPGPVISGIFSNIHAWMIGFWKRAINPAGDEVKDWLETDFDFYFNELTTYLEQEWTAYLRDPRITNAPPASEGRRPTGSPAEAFETMKDEMLNLQEFVEGRFLTILKQFLRIGA